MKSSKSIIQLVLLVLGAVLAMPSSAVQDYYQSSVPVKSQSQAERKSAAKKVFAEVMVRMSGSEDVLENPKIHAAMGKALNYAEQFQYHPTDDSLLASKGYKEQLSVSFAAPTIERLLRQNGQPFWPVNRPTTLVWLVEDSIDYGKQFASSDLAPEVYSGIEAAAARRGLPLSYPLLDLKDQMNLSAGQLWQLDESAILKASQRYNADVILVGRYSSTSQGQILATWQFFHREDNYVYDSRAQAAEQLGALAIDPLADYLGRRYALLPQLESKGALVMQLNGIENFAGYRQAISYIENKAAVSAVQLAAVRQDTLLLYLDADTSVNQFKNSIKLDGRMKAQGSEVVDIPAWQQQPLGSLENPLRYLWVN